MSGRLEYCNSQTSLNHGIAIGRNSYGYHCLRITPFTQDERAKLHRHGVA
jgi:hypothetical protein